MILSKKTKHGLLSMGLAFGILTSSVVSPASVSVLASDYSARNVLNQNMFSAGFQISTASSHLMRGSQKCNPHKNTFSLF